MSSDKQSHSRRSSNRRKFLAGVASTTALGLAGCTSQSSGSSESGGSGSSGSDGSSGGSGTTGGSASGKTKLRFMATASDPNTKETFRQAFKQFNESRSDLNIEVTPEFMSPGSFTQKLNTLIGAGDPPDLALAGAELLQFTDALSDLGSILERNNVPESLRLEFPDVGTPLHPMVLQAGHRFYRSDVWDQAGIDFPEQEKAKTWSTHREHMNSVDEMLPDNRYPSFYLSSSNNGPMQFMWYGYELMSGVNYIKRTGPNLGDVEVSLEEERAGAQQYLQFAKEMYTQYSPETTGYSWQEFIQLFANGTVQQSMYGGRLLTNVVEQAPELESVTKPAWIEMPEKNVGRGNHIVSAGTNKFPDDQPSSVSLNGFGVPKDAPNSELAKEFIKWFFDSDLYVEAILAVPPHNLPIDMKMLDSEPFQQNEMWSNHPEYKNFIQRYVENSYPKVIGRTDPASPYWSQITYGSGIVPTMQQEVLLGQKSIDEAIDAAIPKLEQKTQEVVEQYTSG